MGRPPGMVTQRFVPGEVVLRRYFRDGQITFLNVMRAVRDDDEGLVLWMPVGAPFLRRMTPDGRTPHDGPLAELGPTSLVPIAWQGSDLVVWMPPAEAYSVWWFFNSGAFEGWYVNLEDSYARWFDPAAAGVDTADHALDIVVEPDRSWRWKDEDEFAARTGLPGYWDEAGAAEIRAVGERLAERIESGAYPFDGTWCDFRPDATWTVPPLPPGYDRPRAAL